MSPKRVVPIGIISLLVGLSLNEASAFRLIADKSGSDTWTYGTQTYPQVILVEPTYTSTPLVYWSTAQVDAKNIQYWINSSGTPDVNNETSAVDAAFQSWEDVTTASIAFENAGTTGNTQNKTDGKNTVFWDPDESIIPIGALGLAMVTYNEGTGVMSDVDIVLNDKNRLWQTNGSNSQDDGDTLDVQSIVTHEAGHLFGLHHSNISEATMEQYATYPHTTGWRSLEDDDKWGISWLYPEAFSAVSKGGQIQVTWSKFSVMGGTPDYRVVWGTSGLSYSDSANVGNVDNYTITGLTNGTQYYIAVSQRNASRPGGRSNELSSVPSACRSNFDNSGPSQNKVDLDDFFLFADHYGQKYTDAGYEQRFDLNGNRIVIGPADTVLFDGDYGHNCPYPTKPSAFAAAETTIDNGGNNAGAIVRLLSLEGNDGVVTVRLSIDNVRDLKGYGVDLMYDTQALEFVGIEHHHNSLGNVLAGPGNTPIFIGNKDENEDGLIYVGGALPRTAIPAHNGGFLADISLKKKTRGYKAEEVYLKKVVLLDSQWRKNPGTQERIELAVQAADEGSSPRLFQNTPNPFNPSTTISFKIPDGNSSPVNLTVYNMTGQVVKRLLDNVPLGTGTYSFVWDSRDQLGVETAGGVYLYRLEAGSKATTRKLTIIR